MKHADIDALARLLDGDLPAEEATDEARSLGAFAQALEAGARPLPAMEHKADIRAMLVSAAREQAAAPSFLTRVGTSVSDATARWRYSTRTAAATGAAALALSSGGVSLAAHRALPSDPFYPVKLTLEDIRLAFVGDQVERGRRLLAYAGERLDEAQFAVADGDMAGALRAVREADASARAGAGHILEASNERGEPGLLDLLNDFSVAQRRRLDTLLPHLSGDARAAAEDALVSLRRINERVAVLSGPCAQCGQVSGAKDDGAGGGGGRGDDANSAGAARPDFDLSVIPPASQPFSACDCVTDEPVPADTGGKGSAGTPGKGDKGGNGSQTVDEPANGGGSGDDPADNPGSGGGPGDAPADGNDPNVPDEVEDPVEDSVDDVDDAVDDVEDVIDDVLTNPSPPPPSNLPLPRIDSIVPSDGINLP